MKTLVYITVFIASLAAKAEDLARIALATNKIGTLTLSASAQSALKAFDPEFSVLENDKFVGSVQEMFLESSSETPAAVVGDFNGDRIKDVVLMGRSRKEQLVLALLSGKSGIKVHVLERRPFVEYEDSLFPPMVHDDTEYDEDENSILREKGFFRYLTLVPKGEDLGLGKPVRFKTDAVQVETMLSSSNLYYFAKDNWREWKGR